MNRCGDEGAELFSRGACSARTWQMAVATRDVRAEYAPRLTESQDPNIVLQLHVGQHFATAVLGELFDVKGGRQPVQANPVGRKLNVEVADPIAGACKDM